MKILTSNEVKMVAGAHKAPECYPSFNLGPGEYCVQPGTTKSFHGVMETWILEVSLRRGLVWCKEAGGYAAWTRMGDKDGYSRGACGPGQTMIVFNPALLDSSTDGTVTRTRIAI